MNVAALIVSFGLLIIAMTVHEFAHGWVAYRLGDNTAKYAGRLTLNPIAHIDPIWTILMPLVLFISTQGQFVFGAAKPVPINYSALKNPKRDIIWIGASGPLANFIFAVLLAVLLKYLHLWVLANILLVNLIMINLVLGVFNLIPIPPLDGSRILAGLLPQELASSYARIEPYAFVILIAFIWLGLLGRVVWPIVWFLLSLLGIYT